MNLKEQYIKERNSGKLTYQLLYNYYKDIGYKFKSVEDFIIFYGGNHLEVLNLYLQYGGKNDNMYFNHFLNRIEEIKTIDFNILDSHFGLTVLLDKDKNFIKVAI